jgi:hypothetical protein
MGSRIFRFTLSNPEIGTKIISEPDGWVDAKLKLERHPDFHTLVEYFDGDFIFYGSSGQYDGGINYILNAENRLGLNGKIDITIDISHDDGVDYENVFTGQLDLTGIQHLKDNKISIPIIRNDLWSRFINKYDTPVNILSTTDLYGHSVSGGGTKTLQLTPQEVRLIHHSTSTSFAVYDVPTAGDYFQVDWDTPVLTELDDKFNLLRAVNPDLPVDIFNVTLDGSYAFDIKLYMTRYEDGATNKFTDPDGSAGVDDVDFFIQKNAEAPIQFSEAVAIPIGYTREYSYTGTMSLVKGDQIRVYGTSDATGLNTDAFIFLGADQTGINAAMSVPPSVSFEFPENQVYNSYFKITGDTVYTQSNASGFFVHDVGYNILDRIIGLTGRFQSDFFGGDNTLGTYSVDGCGYRFMLTRGLQVRQYSLSDKPFFISFKKWWDGVNPIFNLSLGYSKVGNTEVIEIEEKTTGGYDPTVSINISNIREIYREYDDSRIFNKIEIGYKKWQSEDITGLDDPQTKHTYSTVIEKINNSATIHSEFVGAALAIEVTRRMSEEKAKDYKFDEDVFIVSINPTPVSSDTYVPELDENFTGVSNIFNSDTRYNLRLTPTRNLFRWFNYFNGFLQKNLTSVYKFVSGEGNFAAVTTMTPDGCRGDGNDLGFGGGDAIFENQDVTATTDYIHKPDLYTIEIDLTWEEYVTIRSNRKKAIGISMTDTDHQKVFIKELEFEVCKGKCKMQVWPVSASPLDIMKVVTGTPGQYPGKECIDFCEVDRITEDGETRITENDQVRIIEDGDCSTPEILSPSVSIAADSESICDGTLVTFTATPTFGGDTPVYQWKLNGSNVGTNSPIYTNSSLVDGDEVQVEMSSSLADIDDPTVESNIITMSVVAILTASVSISASPSNIIEAGESITFTATPTNGGTPSYQWKNDGVNVGTNNAVYTTSSLSDGDVITCVMTSSLPCVASNPVTSNSITVDVVVAESCNQSVSDSDPALNSVFTYPDKIVDMVQGTSGTATLQYDAVGNPNNFTIYRYSNGASVASTGWVGFASFPGPWGASLAVSSSGTLNFTKLAGERFYIVRVQTGTGPDISDAYNFIIPCL